MRPMRSNNMIAISNEEYKEYQQLKNNVFIQRKFDVVRAMKYLENDIDTPIKLINPVKRGFPIIHAL
jgi:hypothetical protein